MSALRREGGISAPLTIAGGGSTLAVATRDPWTLDGGTHRDSHGGMPELSLSQTVEDLTAQGWTAEFTALDGGALRCGLCGDTISPRDVAIDSVNRFEGPSNPDDEAAVFALTCHCGCRGLYIVGYGPSMSGNDADAVAQLSRRRPSVPGS